MIKGLKKELKASKKVTNQIEADHTECTKKEDDLLNKIQELNLLLAEEKKTSEDERTRAEAQLKEIEELQEKILKLEKNMKRYRVDFANSVDVEDKATQKMEVATKPLDQCISGKNHSRDKGGIGFEG